MPSNILVQIHVNHQERFRVRVSSGIFFVIMCCTQRCWFILIKNLENSQEHLDFAVQEAKRILGLRKLCPPTPIYGAIIHKNDIKEQELMKALEVAIAHTHVK